MRFPLPTRRLPDRPDLDQLRRQARELLDRIEVFWGMPLYQCTRYGKHEMARMLLERGADPNGQVYASGTPLSEAYGQRDEQMIALLEQYGGQSNASMAGLYRRPGLARRLLEKYGDASLPDDGFSRGPVAQQLLGAAARGGDPESGRRDSSRRPLSIDQVPVDQNTKYASSPSVN